MAKKAKRPKGKLWHKPYTWVPKKGPLKGKKVHVPGHFEKHR